MIYMPAPIADCNRLDMGVFAVEFLNKCFINRALNRPL